MTAVAVIDVVVVGGGHNGLIAAAYAARAGLSVVVLERDTVAGGAVSTVERFPGYLVDRGSSAHLMIRHTPILDELELARFGLRYIDCDPWAFAPALDDVPAIVFSLDLDSTCESIAASCGRRDAEAYRRFVRVWTPRGQALMDAFANTPTPPQMTRAFWGLRTRDGHRGYRAGTTLAREFMQSGNALLDSWFHNERLKAALAWFGAQSGPPMSQPGTAPMVGFAALMHSRPPGRAIGGSGALTTALLAAIEHHGGHIRLATPATALRPHRNNTWNVECADGTTIKADTVIAACHILTTLDLLDAGDCPSATERWRRDIAVGNGIGIALRLGTKALPNYRRLPPGLPSHGVHSGLGLMVTDRAHLSAAYGDAAAGTLPRRPAVLSMSFSALDSSLAPAGRHLVTLWSQWHPFRLANSQSWNTLRTSASDAIIDEFECYAPGFTSNIEYLHIQTPADIETELGMVGGNIMHVEMSLDHMFWWRPHPELSGTTVPGAPGLLLAGASMHPGGGVIGLSGRTAAVRAIAAHRHGNRLFPLLVPRSRR